MVNHKRADFWLPNFGFKISLLSLLNNYQSGFRKFHSPITSMLKTTNDWLLNIDKGLYTGVVYFDLKKCTVDHSTYMYYQSYHDMR